MSTDPAHSLADAIETPLGAEPVKVKDNLWGQEINVLEEIRVMFRQVFVECRLVDLIDRSMLEMVNKPLERDSEGRARLSCLEVD